MQRAHARCDFDDDALLYRLAGREGEPHVMVLLVRVIRIAIGRLRDLELHAREVANGLHGGALVARDLLLFSAAPLIAKAQRGLPRPWQPGDDLKWNGVV